MKNLELYQTNENGQLVFNWEALELITDEKFSNEIRKEIARNKGEIFKLHVGTYFVKVYVKTSFSYQIFRYDLKERISFSDCITSAEMAVINEHRKSVKK